MKKFLFTLAALLLAGSAYATPDPNNPNYLYVPEFEITEDLLNEYNEVEIPVAAQVNYTAFAFQAEVLEIPQGLNFVDAYKGGDYTITYKNNRGRDAQSTQELFIAQPENFGFFGAQVEAGYWQAPGETAWTSYGVVKWEPGVYEEFVVLVFEVDLENFQPGHIVIKSTWDGKDANDPRNGVTIELWDLVEEIWNTQEGGEITLEGQTPPTPSQVADPVVSFVENGDVLTVTFTCETPGAELFIDGVSYGTMPYSYTVNRTYEDQVIAGTAVAKKADMLDSNAVPFSYTFEAKQKTQTPDPEITMAVYDTYVTITATGEGEVWMIVGDDEAEGNGSASINVNRTYEDFTVIARAKAYGDPDTQTESRLVSETFTVPAMTQPTATTPTITFVPTMNGEEVVSVEVVVENATEYHIWVNEEQIRGEVINASYTEVKNIHVEATNAPGAPYIASSNQGDYQLGKLAQTLSEAPQFSVVEYPTYVEVYATGPNVILYDEFNQEVDPQPYIIPRPAYDPEGTAVTHVMVSATTQQDGEQYAPNHVVYDVNVPMQANPNPDQVGAPIFQGYTEDGVTGYGVTISPSTTGSEIMYRVLVWVPNTEGDLEHVGDLEYGHWEQIQDWTEYQGTEKEIWKTEENASYRVEAYAYIGDVRSNTVATEFTVEYVEPTGINEMNGSKAIANVRYFNMAGQEMQEANGMTIVVTTYTDGTTSAVKVMK